MNTSRHTKTHSGRKSFCLLRPFHRFARNGEGSVAIEFAALALPFALLVFAILESCISFASQQVLMNTTDDVARLFRTGQLRPADIEKDKDLVRNLICDRLEVVVTDSCPGLLVDLKPHATYAQAAAVRIKFTPDNDIDDSEFSIAPGKSESINQLRVFYKWPVMTDFLRKSMSNLKDGKTMHFATVTWKNEPFND